MAIFTPTKNPLKHDYPLLNNYAVFQDLNDLEMRFVWLMSCRSSPIIHKPIKERVVEAIEKCGEKIDDSLTDKIGNAEYLKYINLKFPAYINAAIECMNRFEPEVRDREKIMFEKIIDDLETIALSDISKYIEGSDVKDIKTVMETKISIAKNLPDIVHAYEHGNATYNVAKDKEKNTDFWEKALNT